MKEELKEKIKDKDKLEAKIKKNEKNRRSAANNIKESISYLKKKHIIFLVKEDGIEGVSNKSK